MRFEPPPQWRYHPQFSFFLYGKIELFSVTSEIVAVTTILRNSPCVTTKRSLILEELFSFLKCHKISKNTIELIVYLGIPEKMEL
jgi:hypothetical protein